MENQKKANIKRIARLKKAKSKPYLCSPKEVVL